AGRDDDPRDSRARAGRGARRVLERHPSRDGAVARARGGRAVRGRDVELLVLDDAKAAAAATAERLAEAARAGAEIALTGGSTPRRAYELAAEREPDWSRAGAWWGDERCVDPVDERSNYRLARESLLDRLAGRP